MVFKKSAFIILQKYKKPMTAKEITSKALDEGILTTTGKTPDATMSAEIYKDIIKKGEQSRFIKVDKGIFSINDKQGKSEITEINATQRGKGIDGIIERIHESQYKSDEPSEFENVLKDAFSFLGFEGELIGGSGDTDVVLTANIGQSSYKVTVDGKTSKSGKIIDRQIDWLSLSDHKKKNLANYVIVVGSTFAGGNLLERANEYGVSLLKTEELIKLLKAHSSFPFTLLELRDLFAGSGELATTLDDLLIQNHSRRTLLEQFRIIIEEMHSLQDRLGYFTFDSVAGREKIEELQINPSDIDYIISLLRLPFINGVQEISPNRFILTVRIKDIANIFQQISNLLFLPEKEFELIQEDINKLRDLTMTISSAVTVVREFGSKYFEWYTRQKSIIAVARKENPYKHYCPIYHFTTIFNLILNTFQNETLVSADSIFLLLQGHELAPNRQFKGKAEDYKIRMTLGIMEIEGLIKWTGSKRPIEYKLEVNRDDAMIWFKKNVLEKGRN